MLFHDNIKLLKEVRGCATVLLGLPEVKEAGPPKDRSGEGDEVVGPRLPAPTIKANGPAAPSRSLTSYP